MSNQDKPKIRTSNDLQWYCECGDVMQTIYPIDLTKDSIEVVCGGNKNCKWYMKTIGVRLERREVLYVSDH